MEKRGQISIFIIVAIVIVVAVLGVFLFPQLNILTGDVNPSSYLVNCIEPEVKAIKEVLSKQGGYSEPENTLMYLGTEIQYLCYTAEDYKPCLVQQPLLVSHIEQEIEGFIEPRARQCVIDLQRQYERRGYDVRAEQGEIDVKIVQGSINIEFLSPMTLTKETTQSFDKFSISIDSEWYDLLLTAVSIIDFESTYGDSETTLYIQYYPNLVIDKIRRDEGTVYNLRNIISGDDFTFATRSLVWPRGYGTN